MAVTRGGASEQPETKSTMACAFMQVNCTSCASVRYFFHQMSRVCIDTK